MSASNSNETAERFVAAIEELGALADQPIPILGTDRAPLVAVGLYYHLVNQVAALMLLRSSGFDRACAPLRRSLIEHMLYLIWLADAGDQAVDAMNRGLQHQQPYHEQLTDSTPVACFLTLYSATLALDALLGNPWTEQLTSIAERYDMPTGLPTRRPP